MPPGWCGPLTTWTPPELESNARRYRRTLWRVVEAQHTASTLRLTAGLAEQAQLESILEASKPPLPPGLDHLHYLLATPFRYRPPLGSRFRGPFDAGVWYGAEALRTALAEKSYWQLKFLIDSPATPDLKPVPHTALTAAVRGSAIDLTARPLSRDRGEWTARSDYAPAQALARTARVVRIEIIRYESVRDPEHAACAAVLSPAAFASPAPLAQESWFIAAGRVRVSCVRDVPGGPAFEFGAGQLIEG